MFRFPGGDTLRVAVAQLEPLPRKVYHATNFRLHRSFEYERFVKLLEHRLDELEHRCNYKGPAKSGRLLDMLILPEVYLPRKAIPMLQEWAQGMGAIVVAGLDYPKGAPEDNRQ